MTGQELRVLVDRYLNLLQDTQLAQDKAASELERVLDELALLRGHLGLPTDTAETPEPPDWPYDERRSLAVSRFPGYGYYNEALPMSKEIGAGEIGVGDAIDDIADIAGELAEVAWRFENTSEADAICHYCNSYDYHWGQHLRSLQLYLHSLRTAQ